MTKVLNTKDGRCIRVDADDDGKWITLPNGAHVHLNEGGDVDKGPKAVKEAFNDNSSGSKKSSKKSGSGGNKSSSSSKSSETKKEPEFEYPTSGAGYMSFMANQGVNSSKPKTSEKKENEEKSKTTKKSESSKKRTSSKKTGTGDIKSAGTKFEQEEGRELNKFAKKYYGCSYNDLDDEEKYEMRVWLMEKRGY